MVDIPSIPGDLFPSKANKIGRNSARESVGRKAYDGVIFVSFETSSPGLSEMEVARGPRFPRVEASVVKFSSVMITY